MDPLDLEDELLRRRRRDEAIEMAQSYSEGLESDLDVSQNIGKSTMGHNVMSLGSSGDSVEFKLFKKALNQAKDL